MAANGRSAAWPRMGGLLHSCEWMVCCLAVDGKLNWVKSNARSQAHCAAATSVGVHDGAEGRSKDLGGARARTRAGMSFGVHGGAERG
eukprot:151317-Chlamydomonas_euryale.AAC.5